MNIKLKALLGIRQRPPGWDRRKAGDAARNEKNWAQAAAAYGDYLALNPEDWAIWIQRGHARKEDGHLADAERCYRRAADIDSRQADPFFHLGGLMRTLERHSEAIEFYRRAAELGQMPAWDDLSRLGVVVEPKDREMITSSPWISAETGARILVDAQAARDLGRWEHAETLYKTYLDYRPNSPNVRAELALLRDARRR